MNKSLPLLLATCLLAACGQTGALYLPDEGVTTPVEIRPATAPAAEAPAPAPEAAAEPAGPEDEERDGEAPAGTTTPGSGG